MSNLLNEYLLNYGVVRGGLVRTLYVKLINVVLSSLYVVCNFGFFGCFLGELDTEPAANGLLNGINDTESRILNTGKLSGDFFNRASGQAGKYEYHNEN